MSTEGYKIPALAYKLATQCTQVEYKAWRELASRMLQVYDLWDIVNGTTRRPILQKMEPSTSKDVAISDGEPKRGGTQEEATRWDRNNNIAIVFLQSNIEFDILLSLEPSDSAHEIWTEIENRFGHKAIDSLHPLLASILAYQHKLEGDMKRFATEFADLCSSLSQIENTTDNNLDPLILGLRQVKSFLELKDSFFLFSMHHKSIQSSVTDLELQAKLTCERLYETSLEDGAHRNREVLQPEQKNSSIRGQEGPAMKKQGLTRISKKTKCDSSCTWCTKNGKYAKGHTHRDCWRLKAFKGKERSTAADDLHAASGSGTATFYTSF